MPSRSVPPAHRRAVDGRPRRTHRHGVLYLFEERPVPALVIAAAALGAVLTSAVRQAVDRSRSPVYAQ